MSKRELIARELSRLSERDLDRILAFVRKIEEGQAEAAAPALAAESALAKDWLSPEEDAAWASL
jgi:phage FluMu protein gp41